VSDETAIAIDKEVRSIVDECYDKAAKILGENRNLLELMKDALIEYETIDAHQIDDIMEGKKPRPPADWSDSGDDNQGDARTIEEEPNNSRPLGGPASEH
jgi:cell division protease FtsH